MKRFVAIFTGSEAARAEWKQLPEEKRKAREEQGMKAWMDWGKEHGSAIIDSGTPLGKTKRVTRQGISDIRNQMGAFSIVQAESHEAAAKLFLNHPHFTIFPGDGVEIMECLPIPER